MSAAGGNRRAAIGFIVCLGIVSLFADMTYEGAHSIIGPFLGDLGANMAQVAFISGFGEMLAASLRFFSGRFANRTHAYWTLAIAGYAMNVLAIPGLAFVHTWQAAAVLIVVERTGKAIRGPARDLLLSEATGKVGHGWGFGLHAAMDQTGAFLGPLLMAIIMARTGEVGSAFATEGRHYRARSHRGNDAPSLRALRLECVGVFLDALEAPPEPDEFVDAFIDALRFEPVAGAVEAVERLRAEELRLAVVANWDISLHEHLATLELVDLFDTVVTSAEAGAPKPDPRIFRLALDRLGASPARALHVGDEPVDEEGARAAGMRFEPAPLATAFERWT